MSDFLARMKAQAAGDKKTIVLPEGEDPRTIEAARRIVEEGLANLVILYNGEAPEPVEGAQIVDPRTSPKHEAYAQELRRLRAKKGMTIEQARDLVDDATYFGTMMVKMGDADGLVSGACHSTANTLRPALQILKTAPGTKLVSGFMVVCVPDCEYGDHGTFIFSDIGLNEYPDAEALSEIAIASARSWKQLMGTDPHVAMLSYSSHGSANSEYVDKVAEATALVHAKAPELCCDGELQTDAALDETVGALKAPTSDVAGNADVLVFPNLDAGNIGYKLVQRLAKADDAALDETVGALKAPTSDVAGNADVLVFPNLDAGNIGYKLVQRLAKADAYGPLLQGIAKPVNDLSRGCSATDIVAVVAITAVQAQLAAQA